MAKALYVFITSIAAFKEGLLLLLLLCFLLTTQSTRPVSPVSLIFEHAKKDFLDRMPWQWPGMLSCRLWTTSRQYFCKVHYIISHALYKFLGGFFLPCHHCSPKPIIYPPILSAPICARSSRGRRRGVLLCAARIGGHQDQQRSDQGLCQVYLWSFRFLPPHNKIIAPFKPKYVCPKR